MIVKGRKSCKPLLTNSLILLNKFWHTIANRTIKTISEYQFKSSLHRVRVHIRRGLFECIILVKIKDIWRQIFFISSKVDKRLLYFTEERERENISITNGILAMIWKSNSHYQSLISFHQWMESLAPTAHDSISLYHLEGDLDNRLMAVPSY